MTDTAKDPIDGLPKAECERLARRYWDFANRVSTARNFEDLRMFMESYFRGKAEALRDEFLEANK